jgi:hypothetical protein
MNLEQLKAAGAFLPRDNVKAEIEWNGNTFDIHVRRLAFGDVERLLNSDGNPSVSMIAAAVLIGEEQAPISYEDAERLDVTLAAALVAAVNSVNGAPSGN